MTWIHLTLSLLTFSYTANYRLLPLSVSCGTELCMKALLFLHNYSVQAFLFYILKYI